MTKNNSILEDFNNGEDEDLLGEETQGKEKGDAIIDLVDAVSVDEQGVENKPEAASGEEREVQEEAGKETAPGKGMWEALGEGPELSIDLEEQIKLDEGLEEILSEEDTRKLKELLLKEPVENGIPDKEQAAEEAFTEKESLTEQDERSLQIASAFAKSLKTGEESLIENFSREEIEKTLLQHHTEKGHPIYEAMEKRVAQLKETQRYRIRAAEQKWENRIIGFISGLAVALIMVLLRKYLSFP